MYIIDEAKPYDLDIAYENEKLNEFLNCKPSSNYAYLLFSLGYTYAGIKNNEDYYVIRFECKPKDALPRIKIRNLKTNFSENLTKEDQKQLSICRKNVSKYIDKINAKSRGGR